MFRVAPSAAQLAVEAASLATPRGRLITFSVLGGVLTLMGPHRLENSRSLCIIRNITGHACPACGMTRATAALLRGQVKTAGHYNLLVFPIGTIATFLFIKDIYKLLKTSPVDNYKKI